MDKEYKNDPEYLALRSKARRYLRKGLLFLMFCLIVGGIAGQFHFLFADVISESATVAGWVALWKPMEMFLYDLPELRVSKKKNNSTPLRI